MQSSLTHTSILFLCTLWLCSLPGYAAEYHLHVANIDAKLFLRYVDTQGAPFKLEKHTLPRLMETLNRVQEAKFLVFPDYPLQPVNVTHLPPTLWETLQGAVSSGGPSVWSTASWQGAPAKLALLQVRGLQRNWQELAEVAVQTDGVLRRLPVRHVPLFGGQNKLAVPAMPTSYIQNTLERGTFMERVASLALSHGGLSVLVGRNHDIHFPDTVYLLLQQPDTAATYHIVLGWKNREELEKDGGNAGGAFN